MPIDYDVLEAAVRITEAWLKCYEGNAPQPQQVTEAFETVFDSVKRKKEGGGQSPASGSYRPLRPE